MASLIYMYVYMLVCTTQYITSSSAKDIGFFKIGSVELEHDKILYNILPLARAGFFNREVANRMLT